MSILYMMSWTRCSENVSSRKEAVPGIDTSSIFFFSPGFSHHVGSPVWLQIFLLSTSPCPSPRLLSVHYFSSLTGTRLSISFSVVLSSFSLLYPFLTLSDKGKGREDDRKQDGKRCMPTSLEKYWTESGLLQVSVYYICVSLQRNAVTVVTT